MYLFRVILIYASAIIMFCNAALGQKINSTLRFIDLTNGDSIVKTSVWIAENKIKVHSGRLYYWYSGGKINQNFGGFSGKLIHGKFEVFNNDQKLISQGTFKHGVKIGKWNRWYPNGGIQQVNFYKNGMLTGVVKTYGIDGKLISKQNYKKGLLAGKSYFFISDTVISRKYKEGKEIIKSPKVSRKIDLNTKSNEKQTAPISEKQKQTSTNKSKKIRPFGLLKLKKSKKVSQSSKDVSKSKKTSEAESSKHIDTKKTSDEKSGKSAKLSDTKKKRCFFSFLKKKDAVKK